MSEESLLEQTVSQTTVPQVHRAGSSLVESRYLSRRKQSQARLPQFPFANDGFTSRLLPQERSRCTVNVEQLMGILAGGEKALKRREQFIEMLEADDRFDVSEFPYLDREQAMEKSLRFHLLLYEYVLKNGLTLDEGYELHRLMNNGGPLTLHHAMFLPTIQSQGSPKQVAKWAPLALTFRILGCYAQTELGHGSNVRGIETLATFDPATDEFVVHTPHLRALKWWPGGMGLAATHAVLYARLVLPPPHGDMGVHAFVVPLRDMTTHKLLPGVHAGDIGPKQGWNTIDNGFLRLDNVRIPRDHLLQRYCKVSSEGKYERRQKGGASASRMGYLTMMQIRAGIVASAADYLSRAATIAIRYSCVRQQGFRDGSQSEVTVLDYQAQQYSLLSILAQCYAMHFAGQEMKSQMRRYEKSLNSEDKKDASDMVAMMADLHATSAGLKAVCTAITTKGVDECRLRCGGHGFSKASGLPAISNYYHAQRIVEGDHVILCLQTARFLFRRYADFQAKRPSFEYFAFDRVRADADIDNAETQLQLFGLRAKHLIAATSARIKTEEAAGADAFEVQNRSMVARVRMVEAHCRFVILRDFVLGVQTALQEGKVDKSTAKVLRKLRAVFALHEIADCSGDFLEAELMSPAMVAEARELLLKHLRELRTEAVALCDAWAHPDFLLNSCLGRFDGRVYEALFEFATKSPLTQKVLAGGHMPGFEESVLPLLNGEFMQRIASL